MGWRDQLRPASFRGVPFKVSADDLSAGRRVQVHEYPQRDKPYVEDLGRATRKISVTAYVIGADYMAARDRLLAAIETAGAGELVHPQYGTMQVAVEGQCRISHSADEGGMCQFSLTFVEAGELSFPAASANTAAGAAIKADALQKASITDFARSFLAEGLPDFVSADAVSSVNGAMSIANEAVSTVRGGWSGLAQRVLGNLSGLVGAPTSLATRLMALFGALGDDSSSRAAALGTSEVSGTTVATGISRADLSGVRDISAAAATTSLSTSVPPILAPLARVAATTPDAVVASSSAPVVASGVATPARIQLQSNREAVASLVRRAALVQSARTAAAADWPVYDDAVGVRDRLAQQIDDEAMRTDVPDTVFQALTALRVAVVQDITTRAAGSARLRTVTPTAVQPALVLAYDLYEDASRGDEIVARNRVPHPGFVPVEPLKVLS